MERNYLSSNLIFGFYIIVVVVLGGCDAGQTPVTQDAGGVSSQATLDTNINSSQDTSEISPGLAADAGRGVLIDDLQRSTKVFAFQQAADEGADRGAEIYYYRCWTCHNSYTAEAGSPAPMLEGLFERDTLMSGAPVTDDNVANKIRYGSELMPGFSHTLSDDDIADLITYFHGGDCCVASVDVNLPANPWYTASEDDSMRFDYRGNLDGGPTGNVRSDDGVPREGVMVQLIASQNNIRTTVYSNEAGEYEFPKLPSGEYTLRIARPLRWQPYRRDAVQIDGANQLEEIVLQRVTDQELLPPTLDIMGQMSGAEWLFNLSGSMEEKRIFVENCNWCHSYQQIFRARFDENGWRRIIERMSHYQGSPLIFRNSSGRMEPDVEEKLVQWLTRVRGPDSPDPHFKEMPYPTGPSTEVVVTEYELPRLYLSTHDAAQDSKDFLWYSPHRGPRIGKVDPATGITQEVYIPVPEGCLPGTHWITYTKKGNLWSSQNWAHMLTRINPDTNELHQIKPPPRYLPDGVTPRPCNMSMGGNWAIAPDGYIWKIRSNLVTKTDPETGEYVETWPVENVSSTYGTDVTDDNKFVGGGAWGEDWMIMLDIEKGEVVERLSSYPNQGPGRSAFDNNDNSLWSGGKGGSLVRLESSTRRLKEFVAPLLYFGSFYEANVDKNSEVWAAAVQTGRYMRLDPKTERWITYVLPEPYSHNRKSWIDDTTDPISLWYVDHNSYLVHIQPRQ
ncbi:MAG: streptogramin lyase/mono/diheme cytochrome c family protein [Gammaproteobacteria bacterium]|jgi:streptogramin lyase/mono/diheme cytochrome c family protein